MLFSLKEIAVLKCEELVVTGLRTGCPVIPVCYLNPTTVYRLLANIDAI
jgi:hypothetical protein